MKYLDYVGLEETWKNMNPHVYFFGVCSTPGDVQAKTVIVEGLKDVVAGTRLLVQFNNQNTMGTPTLEVNSAGLPSSSRIAYLIVNENGETLNQVTANALYNMCEFIYDGNGHWVLISNKYSNRIIYTESSAEPKGDAGMIWLRRKV